MAHNEKNDVWVRVHDNVGNSFICPMNELKAPGSATEEELENCVDNGVAGRYAGNINLSN